MQLGVGEALISMLEGKGSPEIVTRSLIAPPGSRVGPITDAERQPIMRGPNALAGKYETTIDRESAYELLLNRAPGGKPAAPGTTGENAPVEAEADGGGIMGQIGGMLGGIFGCLLYTSRCV